ncbi:hypothetical protein JAAARDRAFT_40235 [Jaapia argillacea MUCL 33604]|uniref:TNase-like domain-containing protein n=1 Tax=Jaapia argillacea MUCL 33604 TaxID=933084 RepID=A0A067PM71_9AGAM|nr:hypothetical protein JAAARDRAFT_40235 [Jaapia argillacea MUCL 33604]
MPSLPLPWPFSSPSPPSPPPPDPPKPTSAPEPAPSTLPASLSSNLPTELSSNLSQLSSNLEEISFHITHSLSSLPPHLILFTGLTLGVLSTTTSTFLYNRYFKRIRSSDWVLPSVFARKRWVKGVVTSVGDADNFRLYHTPAFGWRWPLKFRRVPSKARVLVNNTLHIRLAGVDAPEASHFGRPAQPYSKESLAWLKSKIEGKTVYCQLIKRDQYGRIIANVTLPHFLPTLSKGKCLSMEMITAGWVTTYTSAGAEYGKWGREEFERVEGEAKAARRGMWKDGTELESPAEYKKRYANGASSSTDVEKGEVGEKKSPKPKMSGFWFRFSRMFGSKS